MRLSLRPSATVTNACLVALLATAGWLSFAHYDEGRRGYERTSHELAQATSLARQIELLRLKPDRAASESRSDQSLAEAVEKSATSSGLAPEQLARIEPQQPRRSGDSDYLEHATVVQFDGVTLAQLAATLTALRGNDGLDQLRVSTMRMAAPFQSATIQGVEAAPAEPWNVELTLTYFVYSPKTPVPRKT